jgi:hypothetical protein
MPRTAFGRVRSCNRRPPIADHQCTAKKKADKWERDASRELKKPEVRLGLLGACASLVASSGPC